VKTVGYFPFSIFHFLFAVFYLSFAWMSLLKKQIERHWVDKMENRKWKMTNGKSLLPSDY